MTILKRIWRRLLLKKPVSPLGTEDVVCPWCGGNEFYTRGAKPNLIFVCRCGRETSFQHFTSKLMRNHWT